MSTTSAAPAARGAARPSRHARIAGLALAGVVLAASASACSRGESRTLDADGVRRAILTETDFPERDGWTSTGLSSESTNAPVAPTALTQAKGMPAGCRRAFDAWTKADPQRKAGINNNFTKFTADELDNAVIVQLAVRSFEHPPTTLTRLREVVQACHGTMTLTPAKGPANTVTIESNPVGMADADGLRLTMSLDGKQTTLVAAVAQRGQNLAQVVGLGAADRNVPALVQRVLEAQVKKLEDTAG